MSLNNSYTEDWIERCMMALVERGDGEETAIKLAE
jgi:hypothetical protein